MITLISMIQRDGFLPHMILWESTFLGRKYNRIFHSSGFFNKLTQPPVIGISLEKIYEKDQDKGFLEQLLPSIKNYFLWLSKERDNDKDGLISIIHPLESGADKSPIYDMVYEIKNPNIFNINFFLIKNLLQCKSCNWNLNKIEKKNFFNVEGVTFNCIYVQSLRSLSKLFLEIDDKKNSDIFSKMAKKTEKSILKKFYDSETGLFFDLAFINERMIQNSYKNS